METPGSSGSRLAFAAVGIVAAVLSLSSSVLGDLARLDHGTLVGDSADVVRLGIEEGVLVNATGPATIRFAPALTLTQAEIDRYPPVRHAIVRTHPYTARKCLYVMRDDCVGIEGVDQEEAEALIAALADHIVKPAFIYRHQWRRGDVLMWDNCTVQHRAIQDYDMPQRRLMHRTTMGGAVPT